MKSFALRIFSLVLALVSLTLPLAACSGGTSEKGYVFVLPTGVELAVGASGTKAIAALGEASSKTEKFTCYNGKDGTEYIYAYPHFRITTVKTATVDLILTIELVDDFCKTPEGLYIGMSADAAKTAMSGKGTPEMAGESMIFKKGGTKLQVSVSGGTVTGIYYSEV